MIKNEKQYEYSKECARRFEYSIALVEQDEVWKQRDPESWQLDIDVKNSLPSLMLNSLKLWNRLIERVVPPVITSSGFT